jgi:hypothetical protein
MVRDTNWTSAGLIGLSSLLGNLFLKAAYRSKTYASEDFYRRWSYVLLCPEFQEKVRAASLQFGRSPFRNWWIFRNYILLEMKDQMERLK